VSCDAFQIYRGFDVGTGKVGSDVRSEVTHYLIDILPPQERYSVVAFLRDLALTIELCKSEDRPIILCGGTAFYLHAFLYQYSFGEAPSSQKEARKDVRVIGLTAPRETVVERIHLRIDDMLAHGWIDEVERLLSEGIDETCPAFQAIGYLEIVGYLKHRLPYTDMVELIRAKTRQYSKRQMTWFRRFETAEWQRIAD
jgi:tRNA dimethylallyltransferase